VSAPPGLLIRPYAASDRDAVNAVARAAFAQYADDYDDWPTFIEGIGRMAELAGSADLLVAEREGLYGPCACMNRWVSYATAIYRRSGVCRMGGMCWRRNVQMSDKSRT
jgi:hypothetical protein